jgi:mannose-6-phosphate isomerase-like protein (cupin superfamily)
MRMKILRIESDRRHLVHHVNTQNLPGSDAPRKFEGGKHGSPGASFFLEHNNSGGGPRPHRHGCDETFSITESRVLVRTGDEQGEGGPGDIAISPPGIPPGLPTWAWQGPADLSSLRAQPCRPSSPEKPGPRDPPNCVRGPSHARD